MASVRRHAAFSAGVSARLDELSRCVEADIARFGAEVMCLYRMERIGARMRGDWTSFRLADDKLTCLQRIAT